MTAYDPNHDVCARCAEPGGVHKLDCPEPRTTGEHKHLVSVTLEILADSTEEAAERAAAFLSAAQHLAGWSFQSAEPLEGGAR
jgi:hypothetical protein